MDLVFEYLKWGYQYYTTMISRTYQSLSKLPEGRLLRKGRNGKDYYYRWVDKKQVLIKKGEETLIAGLARTYYSKKCLDIYETNRAALSKCLKQYIEYTPEAALDNLPHGYSILPKELFFPRADRLSTPFRERGKKHKAVTGDKVRSKSEAIIIGLLDKYGIFYEYEPQVWIDGTPYRIDLKIISPRDNKVIYYEHFGRMDKLDYRVDAVNKILLYAANNIKLWDNFIATFDTEDGCIDVAQIERIIKTFIL